MSDSVPERCAACGKLHTPGTRKPHPRCPQCGFALYKHPLKGMSVKPHWPYAFCRNFRCALRNKRQAPSPGSAT